MTTESTSLLWAASRRSSKGRLSAHLGYQELREQVNEMKAGQGLPIKVLKLARLIEVKSQTAGDKDLAMLPILRQTLEEKRRK